jgi:hypothetical protein
MDPYPVSPLRAAVLFLALLTGAIVAELPDTLRFIAVLVFGVLALAFIVLPDHLSKQKRSP